MRCECRRLGPEVHYWASWFGWIGLIERQPRGTDWLQSSLQDNLKSWRRDSKKYHRERGCFTDTKNALKEIRVLNSWLACPDMMRLRLTLYRGRRPPLSHHQDPMLDLLATIVPNLKCWLTQNTAPAMVSIANQRPQCPQRTRYLWRITDDCHTNRRFLWACDDFL